MSGNSYHYAEHPSEAGAPLLFVFHGTGGNEGQFFGLGRQLLPNARVIAPRGDVSENGALRFFRRKGEGLYDMEDLRLRTGAMAAFIAARQADTQPGATIGLGFSNGANILASVLITQPQLLDAAVLMHPLIPFAPPPQPALSGKRVLITAGQRDPMAPADTTQALADYLEEQGARVTLLWHEGGHEIRAEEIAAARAFLAA